MLNFTNSGKLFFIVSLLPLHCLRGEGIDEEFRISSENADCPNAIEVTEPVFGPTNPPEGHGDILEFSGNELGDPHFIQREHHTVWYYFEMPASGTLTFEIIPEDIEDDYDFMLFEYTGEDFCKEVKTQDIKPVRTNISRNNKAVESRTGLSEDAERKYVPAGPNPDFSKSLEVEEGQVFYLLVDNVYDGGDGHTLKIDFPREKRTGPSGTIVADVIDKMTEEYIDAAISFRKPDDTAERTQEMQYKAGNPVELQTKEVNQTYLITAAKDEYLFNTKGVRNEPGTNRVTIELSPIEVGAKLSLHNIHFVSNEDHILPHSQPELDNLIEFLSSYETLEVEVQGHVNGPGRPNIDYYQELSDDRAIKIKNFLIDNGVAEDRIDWKGFGNTQMIFRQPRSNYESMMNRRVEVEITGISDLAE